MNEQTQLFETDQSWSRSELERREAVLNGETVIANLKTDKRLIAWATAQRRFVRIDRKTKWGNPFVLGRHGNRDEVCEQFAQHLLHQKGLCEEIQNGALRAKVLACWCHPQRCHGETLIAASETAN